jgi:anti-sigma regulatory factor (Ser/Thr protein kinase)
MWQLTVPAVLASIAPVSTLLKEVAATAGLDTQLAYRLRLAVVELVTNTITHGYLEANRSGAVELRADMDERTLTVTLEDTGVPFDPTQALPPDLTLPADQRKIGGLGVYLALRDVGSYRYERAGDRNRSVLVVDRPAPAPAGNHGGGEPGGEHLTRG